jgi:hypothetical protein
MLGMLRSILTLPSWVNNFLKNVLSQPLVHSTDTMQAPEDEFSDVMLCRALQVLVFIPLTGFQGHEAMRSFPHKRRFLGLCSFPTRQLKAGTLQTNEASCRYMRFHIWGLRAEGDFFAFCPCNLTDSSTMNRVVFTRIEFYFDFEINGPPLSGPEKAPKTAEV